ncbi:reverse transcriptase, partial [Tanacetum coccineum]
VEYLGHFISSKGVATHPTKIQAVIEWPEPKNIKQLRGFLGLTGYFRKFIRNYALKSRPLTVLLKKYAFQWNNEAQRAFEELKEAMTRALRLTIPFQTKWLPKLLGFDYEISYKSGSKNVVADALSRISSEAELNELVLTSITTDLMKQVKDNAMGGHLGTSVTLHMIKEVFFWKGMQKMMKQTVKECDVCQREKHDLSAYPVILQPLPIPEKIWSSISMDFIEKLPSSHGKSVILVVVGRLSKLHGMPESITEIVNKCLECYLRCMTGERPKEWTLWLPMAEFWYNTNFHCAINTTPFQMVYGQTPLLHIPYVSGDSLVESVDRTMQAREDFLQVAKFHLKRAQDRMISQANKHRSDRVLEVGMWVYLRKEHQHKLCSNCVMEIHTSWNLPHCEPNGVLSAEPVTILYRRLAKVNNKAAAYILVKWSNHADEDATWENYADLIQRYLGFERHA